MMDGSSGPAPFLLKTYEMVDDHFTNAVVSWSQNGHSFVVWNPPDFARVLLPKYFKHNNFSSFIRQLNTYGFRKIDPEQWEFANQEFIRGKTHLLKNIHRRKPIHSHSGHGNAAAVSLTHSQRQEFEKKIGMLRQENLSLQSHLERQRQEGIGYGDELRSLGLVLQNIDFRHQQMMTTLSQLLQKPAALYPSVIMESCAKKRRLSAEQILHGHGSLYITTSLDTSSSSVNMEQVQKLESAVTSLEKMFHGIEQAVAEVPQDITIPGLHSITSREMSASSGDSDFNIILPPRFNVSACSSQDSLASPEFPYAECLAMPPSIHISSRQNLSGIDMTKIPHTQEASKDGQWDVIDSCVQDARSNDVFWQQFLTEAPGSTKS